MFKIKIKVHSAMNAFKMWLPIIGLAFLSGCGSDGDADSTGTPKANTQPDSGTWEMIWSDEFDGVELNSENWNIQQGDGSAHGLDRWGNNELQWYWADNVTVEDGNLIIAAKQQQLTSGFPYTSGRIRSNGKVDIKYGRVEARLQVPAGQGLWSAFWMLPTDSPYGGWASSGEIDIMEAINPGSADKNQFGTLHHGFPWPLNEYSGQVFDTAPEDGFHTYAIEWERDEIRWYIDDVNYNTVKSNHWFSYYYAGQDMGYVEGSSTAPFDVDFHILLNLAVGGNLPGPVAWNTNFPAEMLVDYVRVFSCDTGNEDGTGCASNVNLNLSVEPAKETFIASYDLYTDSADSLSLQVNGATITRALAIDSYWDNGVLVLSEVIADVDAINHGTVIDVDTSDKGNFSLFAADGEPLELFGMGSNPEWWKLHAGELKFDLYIDSANTDLQSSLLIKMDSGYPKLGFVELAIEGLPLDEWSPISIKMNDLLKNSGEQSLDTSAVMSLFVLEPTGSAHVQIDNIKLVCGHPEYKGCGISQ